MSRFLLIAALLLAGSGVAYAQDSSDEDVDQVIDIEDGLDVDGAARGPKELLTLGRDEVDEPSLLPNRGSFVDEMVESSRKDDAEKPSEVEYDFSLEQVEGDLLPPEATDCGLSPQDEEAGVVEAPEHDVLTDLVESADRINE